MYYDINLLRIKRFRVSSAILFSSIKSLFSVQSKMKESRPLTTKKYPFLFKVRLRESQRCIIRVSSAMASGYENETLLLKF